MLRKNTSTVADGLELSHQLLTNKTKRPWALVGVNISESSHTLANAKEVVIRIRAGRTTDSRVEW